MPRDQRLYMTFPIDIHRHPKVQRLSAAVRWTFVEMNGEARIADNDGIFTEAEAEYLWPLKHLQALAASHPERPLVIHKEGSYTLRDYAEHQETKASRAARVEKNRLNGKKGGRPTKNPDETEPKPTGFPKKANVTQPKAESESESELKLDRQTDVTTDITSVTKVNARESDEDDNEYIRDQIQQLGIKNLSRVRTALARVIPGITDSDALDLTRSVLELSTNHVRSVEAYIETAALNSPAEIQGRWEAIPRP